MNVREYISSKGIELPMNIIEELEESIKKRKIKDEDVIRRIVDRIIFEYERSKVEPGEAVGVVAAQSIGEPGTQMMMRTKHYAGAAMEITRGLPRLIEIVDAKKTPKTPQMKIYLSEKYKKDRKMARKIANKIRETTLEKIAEEISIDLVGMNVVVRLDEDEIKRREIDRESVLKAIRKIQKINVKVEGNKIVISKKNATVSDLFKIKDKLKNAFIKGIRGIKHVIILEENGEYVIYTSGTNLAKVLNIKGIDPTRTISNDIFEIADVLGIEAARNAIINEAMATLEDAGLTVDVRHIMLVADIMTFDGVIKGIGRHGVAGEKANVLARASFEETVKHLFNASARGEIDHLDGVIESIIVGKVAPIGTGITELRMKRNEP